MTMLRISALAAPFLLLSLPAFAVEATQVCPAWAGPQHVKQLTALFNDAGNHDPADDLLEVTLTLCAKAGARSAYQVSFDAVAPRFSDADRTGDGKVSRKDFCAETRDGSAALSRGVSTGLGTTVLVRGAGSAPDAVRFSVPVDAVAAGLARDGVTEIAVWAETRLVAATLPVALPYTGWRVLADYLPTPGRGDICAKPQAAAEVLSVALTSPAPACPADCSTAISQFGSGDYRGMTVSQACGYDALRRAGSVSLDIKDIINNSSFSLSVIASRCIVGPNPNLAVNSILSAAQQAACAPLAATVATAVTGLACNVAPPD